MDEAKPATARDAVSRTDREPCPLTFTLFPKLPTEIRSIIWKLTIEPRVVEMKFDDEKGFYSTIDYPVALEVCRDSRQAVIPSYSLCFGSSFYRAHTRFNFSLDTVYLDSSFLDYSRLFLVGLRDEEVSKIQHFAIDEMWEFVATYESPYNETLRGINESLQCMTSLNDLIEVHRLEIWSDNCSWDGDDSGKMEFLTELPPELSSAELNIDPNLPPDPQLKSGLIKVPNKTRAVFGHRKTWKATPIRSRER
jgi:hypothetical protein